MKKKSNELVLDAVGDLIDKKTVSDIVYNHIKYKDIEKAKKLIKKFNISIFELKKILNKNNKFNSIKDNELISIFGEKEVLRINIHRKKNTTKSNNMIATFIGFSFLSLLLNMFFVIGFLGLSEKYWILSSLSMSGLFSLGYFVLQRKQCTKLQREIKRLIEHKS